jgi:hypothetical protein
MKKLFLLLILLLIAPSILAFFPNSHYQTVLDALEEPQNTFLYNYCNRNVELCLAGDMLSDVSVYWYYTKFINYKITHTPALCSELLEASSTDDEKSCAVGACIHQQGADIVSHTMMVPGAIRNTYLPNAIIHPFAEQKLDLWVEDTHKEVDYKNLVSLQDFETCVPLFLRVMSTNDAYLGEDLESKFDNFIHELTSAGDTGYDSSFQKLFIVPTATLYTYVGVMVFFLILSSLLYFKRIRFKERRTILNWSTFLISVVLLIFMAYLAFQFTQGNAFDTFTKYVARPVAQFVPLDQSEKVYFDEAVKRTKLMFEKGEPALYNTDASGQAVLLKANEDIKTVQYIIFFIVGLLIVFLIYRNFLEVKPKGFSLGGI